MRTKVRRIAGLVITLALIFMIAQVGVFLLVVPALASSAGYVEISINAPNELAPGSDFTATVEISQVEDFDACNYDVSINPTVLRLDNVTSGDIGGTVIPVDIWNKISPGTYTVVQNIPGLSGVAGSGHLVVLHFYVVGSQGQNSNISLSNGVLGSNLAEAIPAIWTGGSVHVNSAGASGQELPSQDSPSESETTDVSEAEPAIAPPDESTPTSETEPGTPEFIAEEEGATTPDSSAPPESETADISTAALPLEPSGPPSAQLKPIDWPLIWGVVGGVVLAFGLIIFFWIRKRSY